MPKPRKAAKPATAPAEIGLTAADCARRTGLTVRALRVYERAGLLKPRRSAKGWRVYGPEELIRLSTITALKGFGLSLREIRKTFGSPPLALAQVLDLHMRNWTARKMAAERSITLILSAIARLKSRDDLTVEELCELMRNTEVDNMNAIVRELINEHITPEQEREWLTYWAKRQPQDVQDGQEEMNAFRTIAQEFHALMKRGAAPDSAAVQEVQERSHKAWLRSNLRQRQLEQLAWNPEVTRAWFALGGKLMARTAAADGADAAQLEAFIHEARKASRSSRLLMPIVLEATRLRAAGRPPEDPEARQLAARFAAVCQEEGMGDPKLHARWIAAFGPNEQTRPGWEYLADLAAA